VAHPAHEAEVWTARAWRDVRRDHRRFDDQRARAAHRVQELDGGLRFLRPTGANQDARRQVFAQRRFARFGTVAATVQAFAGEIDRHGDVRTVRVGMHAHVRAIGCDIGPAAGGVAQLITDRVLQAQRAEACMRDLGVTAREIASQRTRCVDVLAPVDGARSLVEAQVRGRGELRDHEKHAAADPRFETGAIRDFQRA
jgi:hypothetical protein